MTETKLDRRNILAVLGLGGAVGMSTEAVAEAIPLGDGSLGLGRASKETQLKIAGALEKLAGEIRDAKVAVKGFNVHSDFTHGEWIEHSVKLTVEILG